jgi:hypothetical protein
MEEEEDMEETQRVTHVTEPSSKVPASQARTSWPAKRRKPGGQRHREVQQESRTTRRAQTGTFLRDKEDWRFNRREFRALQEEFGQFTLDACADVLGANAHCARFCSKWS